MIELKEVSIVIEGEYEIPENCSIQIDSYRAPKKFKLTAYGATEEEAREKLDQMRLDLIEALGGSA